jgi:hypothetical protein
MLLVLLVSIKREKRKTYKDRHIQGQNKIDRPTESIVERDIKTDG